MSKQAIPPDNDRPAIAAKHPWLTMGILLAGTFLSLINETMMNVAFTTLEQELGVSTSTVQWLTVGYILVVAIIIPLTSFLIHSFTTKQLFCFAMGMFLAGALPAAFTNSFAVLLTARILQAVGAGMSVSIVLGAGLALLPPSMHGLSTSICACVATLGPALGPVYAGIILNAFPWQMMFKALIPPTAIILILTLLFMENASDLSKPHLDILSFIESGLGMFLVIFGISRLGSAVIPSILCMIAGVLVMVVWYRRQLKPESPYIDVRLLGIKGFPSVCIMLAFTNLSMLSISILVPMIYQQGYEISVFHASLLMLPAGLMLSIFAPFAGRTFDKKGAKGICIIGTVLITAALLALGLTGPGMPVVFYVLCSVAVYFGISISQSPLQSHIYAQCAPEKKQDAIALTNVGMQIGGSGGSSVAVLLLTCYQGIFAGNDRLIFISMRATFLTLGVLFLLDVLMVFRLFRGRK